MARRALLIGAEHYGKGFDPLPAVRNDVALIQEVLTACRYVVEVCDDDTVRNAQELDKNIQAFLRRCRAGDVHIVYFSGHGVLIGNADCIVPGGVSREQAMSSATQTVSTDFGSALSEDAGLALFIIDACRNADDAPTVASSQWGDPEHQSIPRQGHFLRLFGCRSGEVCQVLAPAAGAAPVSLFTRALASTLSEGGHASLSAVLADVEKRCDQLARSANLATQRPRISLPREFSAQLQESLNRAILDRAPERVLPKIWDAFDPNRFHCVVVQSEQERQAAPVRDVIKMVRNALIGATGKAIWDAFRPTAHGRRLVSNRVRDLRETFDPTAVRFSACNVVDVLTSAETLDRAVRAIVEADLVVFDVTDFEPAIMLLIGIRAATARGLTICSHGGQWEEGTPLKIPFNLQNLNVQSHTPSKERTGLDPVVPRFSARVVKGYDQLRKHSHYLDLPAYDDLRQLGSDYDASSTISARKSVLVLCSYQEEFFEQWRFVQSELKFALWEAHQYDPAVERIIDHGTPQVVSQALYEQLRRGAACVMDWSNFSASTFMELGIRLAVSSRGAVQLVEQRFVQVAAAKLVQVQRLLQIFNPEVYAYPGGSEPFFRAAEVIAGLEEKPADESNPLHRVVTEALNVVQGSIRQVHDELRDSADALHHRKQGSEGVAQILFHRSFDLKRDSERAALERRVAAWLYLDQRKNAGEPAKANQLLELYVALGNEVAAGLSALDGADDAQLAKTIRHRVKRVDTAGGLPRVASLLLEASTARTSGDAYRAKGKPEPADEEYEDGVASLAQALEVLQGEPWKGFQDSSLDGLDAQALAAMVEVYGSRGGLLQRLGRSEDARASYEAGADLERRFGLGSTYNRLNAVKCRLRDGQRLEALLASLEEIATAIEGRIAVDQATRDRAWTWSDLGDCRALLGNIGGAEQAYSAFVARSETKSPKRALDMLTDIHTSLERTGDPAAARVGEAISTLEKQLAASGG